MFNEDRIFFINSNIADSFQIDDFDKYIKSIGGNIGNSYITYSVIKILYGDYRSVSDIKNLWLYQPNKTDIDKINNEFTKVVLILQDNLRPFDSYYGHNTYSFLADFFKAIKIPIVVFSLGCNYFNENYHDLVPLLNKDLINLLKIIADKTVSFGVRGEVSKEILYKIGIYNVDVVGCPSYYECGRGRIVKKPKVDNLKIVSGGFFESSNFDVNYVLQDESLFIKNIFFQKERITEKDLEKFSFDNPYHNLLFNKLLENRLHYFNNIEQWKSFNKEFDFYVGTRVHGAIVTLNSGLPAVITNKDLRAREMSNLFGIKNCDVLKDDNLFDLYESIDVDLVNKRYIELFEIFEKWLNKNDLKFIQNSIPKKDTYHEVINTNNDNYDLRLVNILFNEFKNQKNSEIKELEDKNISNLLKLEGQYNRVLDELNKINNEMRLRQIEIDNIRNFTKKNCLNYKIKRILIKIFSCFIIKKNIRKQYRDSLLNKII